ncbi:TIGR03088 family PEP-CTERM/XrtA system glycosyltransferase [Rheinheimera sp. SA_1]|uniref:TIGR03088 family PEP-CTERM/XrtA system glycosyltransferase n=1 Tax=Rheinheimera sp. SA_1 TaxID=1827365 RepID=UPI0018D37D37|nr:TIGR03088 family PEP-CTERM/XrtA system glycosyltransferase [Rheinheimera sp. SA_1]
MSSTAAKQPPLVVHLIYCLDTGGLERVMLNCIRGMANQGFRHAVVSLTHATSFANQLPADVPVYCLGKKPGADLSVHLKLWRLLRDLRPAILHSYNLATLEYHPVSWLAGVRGHFHAEHGRDVSDPKGNNKKYQWLRRLISPFVQRYIAVSDDLNQWLLQQVRLPKSKVQLIYNGINTDNFNPTAAKSAGFNFIHVARLAPIKDQATLIAAFVLLRQQSTLPCRLLLVGDGPLRQTLQQQAMDSGIGEHIEFLGERQDIAALMQQSQVFVMSSLSEGIPMTILEAMACSLPIVATAVGGIPELIQANHGTLVAAKSPAALANAMQLYLEQPELAASQGQLCRLRVCEKFSEPAMVAQYLSLYRAVRL